MTQSLHEAPAEASDAPKGPNVLRLLWADKFATVAVVFLAVVVIGAVIGPAFLTDIASKVAFRSRNLAPFHLDNGLMMILGSDSLGRPILARMIVASQNTMLIAALTVLASSLIGGMLGLVAGYSRTVMSDVILRMADVIMSFPSLLLAVIVLYMLEPAIGNLVLVLAITRIPVYLRTTRAEVLEVRERMFVQAAKVMGASTWRIGVFHILPMVLPTLLTIATLDFAFVMLAESSLSFLGIGIQPPEVTWGLMVAQGRPYMNQAWWLSFWPGLMIVLTAMSLNLLSNWLRTALDPTQRWRLETRRESTND